jgi:hypothetical protein
MSEQSKYKRGVFIETALWIIFAVVAYALSFEFDKDIETYKFNATGWPRVVLILTVLAALGHLLTSWRDVEANMALARAEAAERGETDWSGRLRVLAMLILPLIYAYLLQDVGFYILTPFFIFLILFIGGERRIKWLLGVTFVLYGLLLFIFARLLFLNLPIGTAQPFYNISNWMLEIIRIGT